MPVWHEATSALRAAGRLEVLGLVQEQHPDRCRLLALWKGLDFPILWDPFNVTRSRAVPRFTAIDEHGVVRAIGSDPARIEAEFLDVAFPAPETPAAPAGPALPALVGADAPAPAPPAARPLRALSDLLWNVGDADAAMAGLREQAAAHPEDAVAHWRLGVALRMRHDSAERHDGDFQAALDHWARALEVDPGHYIYRRRLEQYGPRAQQPYPFYDWIPRAQAELGANGVAAPPLVATLSGTEVARDAPTDAAPPTAAEPDPAREVPAPDDLLSLDSAVAWGSAAPDGSVAARVHAVLRPSGNRVLFWDAQAGSVLLWLDLPEGWQTPARALEHRLRGDDPVEEQVAFDFEVRVAAGAERNGTIHGYALYHASLDEPGEPHRLRHDFRIPVPRRP